ncbi:MAG: geranylgeranylglyceryl/heptaprenylglyceryl phosphate synthase [Chitinophagales bacterium]|nr:geranylgeranylglyceryl/heptaprenylglyceryl phosphate synthase [Chitinophagales bacterium]MCZ2393937.1 geranylgeranylglyceryl/heptaprenylglyceryl phosphate synthase [Chitinophagales bacterium]
MDENDNFETNEYILNILSLITKASRQLAVLIDPDKYSEERLSLLTNYANKGKIHFFLIGGSLVFKNQIKFIVEFLKARCEVPVLIFPGNPSQIEEGADGLLLLSLISGRNSDLLIGRHVEAAPLIKQSGLEVIPTGYILIDGGKSTSVSYISNTTPIPSDKGDIVAATAMAGELLGLQLIYLEAGSGALNPVPLEIIERVKKSVDIPLIVGGGIKDATQLKNSFDAGANIVVIGTAIEQYPHLLSSLDISVSQDI